MQTTTPTIDSRSEAEIALDRAREQMRAAFNAKAPGALEFADEYVRRQGIYEATLKNTGRRIY